MLKRGSKLKSGLLLPAVAVLTACSGIPLKERDAEQRDRYHQYAGDPVDHITYLGRYDGWTAIGKHELVVFTNINDAYLITVQPPCEDLMFANSIGLTETAHTVYQKFDFVKVRGWRCMIKSIQPVNYRQMKRDMRQKTADAKAATEAAQQEQQKQ